MRPPVKFSNLAVFLAAAAGFASAGGFRRGLPFNGVVDRGPAPAPEPPPPREPEPVIARTATREMQRRLRQMRRQAEKRA